ILGDKIICDLDKTPDLSQRSPQNCPKCGHRSMVIIVKDVLFSERSLRNIFLHLVLNMEFSKILLSHPMTIPTLLMLLESHSLAIKTLIPACCDDDDDDYAFAITPNEPDNSLSIGDEHLDTIPATKTDEFIKSSVENLVPILSEFEGESEYFTKEIYSNPLFDEDIIPMKIDLYHFNVESDLIESMLNHDSSFTSSSSKIDSLFDEFAGKLTLLKSISPGIDETDCDPEDETRFIKRLLYDNSSPHPPEEFIFENSDADIESFSPSPILRPKTSASWEAPHTYP
nr:hypothetical protein [Tanacetum cinerariifolium]